MEKRITRYDYEQIASQEKIQALRKTIKSTGVCIITDALSPGAREQIKHEIESLRKQDAGDGTLLNTDGSIRVSRLTRSDHVRGLVGIAIDNLAVPDVLQTQPVLSSLTANIVMPGAPGMGHHRDYPYFAMPSDVNPSAMPILSLQVIWALDDFTADNGATSVFPISHRCGLWIEKETFDVAKVPLIVPAGSAVLMHGAVFHGVAPNTSDKPRTALLASCVPYWVRPMHKTDVNERTATTRDIRLAGKDFKNRIRQDLLKVGYGVARPEK